MSIPDEELELLIGRLVDGEISPDEKERLDGELATNSRARILLEQTQVLSESCRKHMASHIKLWPGEAQDTFHRVWQKREWSLGAWFVRLQEAGHLRFAAGLAAGFVLGLVLHFALARSDANPETLPQEYLGPGVVAQSTDATTEEPAVPFVQEPVQVVRNVDWYTFTDDAGNQWLVEGVLEGMVQPAAYYGEVW